MNITYDATTGSVLGLDITNASQAQGLLGSKRPVVTLDWGVIGSATPSVSRMRADGRRFTQCSVHGSLTGCELMSVVVDGKPGEILRLTKPVDAKFKAPWALDSKDDAQFYYQYGVMAGVPRKVVAKKMQWAGYRSSEAAAVLTRCVIGMLQSCPIKAEVVKSLTAGLISFPEVDI